MSNGECILTLFFCMPWCICVSTFKWEARFDGHVHYGSMWEIKRCIDNLYSVDCMIVNCQLFLADKFLFLEVSEEVETDEDDRDSPRSIHSLRLYPGWELMSPKLQYNYLRLYLDVCIGRLGIVLGWMLITHDFDIEIECQHFCLVA
jgi:hypothetical protein